MFIVANHHVDQRNGAKPGAEMCIALPVSSGVSMIQTKQGPPLQNIAYLNGQKLP